ncbi:MAG: hypothetical protein E7050_10560 [Lentisphaerae bacterium]|nr:hypothetical protein [Lentisphaerota bacterium]
MSEKQPNLNDLPELGKERIPADAAVRKHRAGALFRVNLPPLMGRRDAVLDAAETLIRVSGRIGAAERETLYSYLHGLFAAAESNTSRISGMFNNHDTVAREQRLSLHIGVLAKLSASLDEFCMLKMRMLEAALLYADDPTNEFDTAYTEKVNERMLSIEENLLAQLSGYFDRVRERIARYRLYAVKNFSKEYLDRYQKSYQSVVNRCNEAFELFSVKISTPN